MRNQQTEAGSPILGPESAGRRRFLRVVGLGSVAALFAPGGAMARRRRGTVKAFVTPTNGEFTLPPLPYAYNALEPHIDTETMVLHHDRHHAGYVTQLNNTLQPFIALREMSLAELLNALDTLPADIRTSVRNNGGGHINHSIFWATMSPNGGGEPTGALAQAINAEFGNLNNLKTLMGDAAVKRFGSGWAWLIYSRAGKLQVTSTQNQDSPYMDGDTPLFGIDVWEHAYYLKYRNRRADYVSNWWNTVNWEAVAQRYEGARA